MWYDYVENKNSLSATLSNSIPDLDDIFLNDLKIISGEDIQIYLRFDINAKEIVFTKKWIEREYNTLQITLLLMATKMNCFNMEYLKYPNGKITIHELGDLKTINFESLKGECIFLIEAKWIYANSINGYKNELQISSVQKKQFN